jgi:protein TonB
MNISTRRVAISVVLLASLCGCKAMGSFAANSPTTILRLAAHLFHHKPTQEPAPAANAPALNDSEFAHELPAPAAGSSRYVHNAPALDLYKTEVAHHVVQSNPGQTFSGKLPEMLPAIVVLSITVDRDGNLTDVEVQRFRDADAAQVAVTSIKLSDPLPKPAKLLARNSESLTFSETFLVDSEYRFQLRSLAGPQ